MAATVVPIMKTLSLHATVSVIHLQYSPQHTAMIVMALRRSLHCWCPASCLFPFLDVTELLGPLLYTFAAYIAFARVTDMVIYQLPPLVFRNGISPLSWLTEFLISVVLILKDLRQHIISMLVTITVFCHVPLLSICENADVMPDYLDVYCTLRP